MLRFPLNNWKRTTVAVRRGDILEREVAPCCQVRSGYGNSHKNPAGECRRCSGDDRNSIAPPHTAAHWTQRQYGDIFRAGEDATPRFIVVAKTATAGPAGDPVQAQAAGQLYGFLVARNIAPEWELENIVVLQTARRKGLGRRLLEALLDPAPAEQTANQCFSRFASPIVPRALLYEQRRFPKSPVAANPITCNP